MLLLLLFVEVVGRGWRFVFCKNITKQTHNTFVSINKLFQVKYFIFFFNTVVLLILITRLNKISLKNNSGRRARFPV